MNNKLSIILPAKNESAGLENLLKSIRSAQPSCELIVVNDGSTDNTGDIVEAMKGDYPELQLVHNSPPGGLGRGSR